MSYWVLSYWVIYKMRKTLLWNYLSDLTFPKFCKKCIPQESCFGFSVDALTFVVSQQQTHSKLAGIFSHFHISPFLCT